MPAFSILFFWMLCSLPGIDVESKKLRAPLISIKPSGAFSLGGNGSIVCEGPFFLPLCSYLEKDGQEISSKEGTGNIEFPITNASREHGGIYTCYYKSLKSQSKSERSRSMELLIRDPTLPRPSIYLHPSRMAVLGSNITIVCMVKGPSKRFYLDMGGKEKIMALYEGFAFFHIDNIDWDNGKSYHCSYSSQSGFFISEPSNPVELLIVDSNFPRPSISLSPMDGAPVGSDITINCRSQDMPKSFYLQKLGGQRTDELMQASGTAGKFLISNASWDHQGYYSCRYHPKSEPFSVSEPSHPVELLITDPDLLKPTISLRPTGIAHLRSNITICCSISGSSVMFHLYKTGELVKSQPMEPDGDEATFSINNVSIEHSGVYHCCYRRTLQTSFISQPSNHVELLVLDPSLPRPEISILPIGQAALGGKVNIKCESKDGSAKFFLHKAEDSMLKWPMKNAWDVGEILISDISWEHQGNYSCSYALDKRPSAFSAHSDPVALLVSEPPDYTWINITCFAIGGLILLLLACIVIGDHHFWKEQWTQNEATQSCPTSVSLSFPTHQ